MKNVLLMCALTFSLVLTARLPDLIPYRKGNLWGYSDSAKRIIIEPKYAWASFYKSGYAVVRMDSLCAVIDEEGNTVIPFGYKSIYPLSLRGYWIVSTNGLAGVIDSTGKNILPPERKGIFEIGGGILAEQVGDTIALMNLTGRHFYKCVVHLEEEGGDRYPEYIDETGDIIISSNGFCGVIDTNGRSRIAMKYRYIHFDECGYYVCDRGREDDYYDRHGRKWRKRGTPENYVEEGWRAPGELYPDYILITKSVSTTRGDSTYKDKLWGWKMTDSLGWIVKPKYESTGYFQNGTATFTHNGRMGLVDANFREVLPARYRWLTREQMNIFRATGIDDTNPNGYIGLFLGYVDIHGTEYWEN